MDYPHLTSKQHKALAELGEITQLTGFDLTSYLEEASRADWHSADIQDSVEMLTRGYLVTQCVVLDEVMDRFWLMYFLEVDTTDPPIFDSEDLEQAVRAVRVMHFTHFVLERLYLLDKYRVFREVMDPPRWVNTFVQTANDLRNGAAHTFILENRRVELTYKGSPIFSAIGLRKFVTDANKVQEYFVDRFDHLGHGPSPEE